MHFLLLLFGIQSVVFLFCEGRSALTDEEADEPILDLSKLGPDIYGYPDEELGETLENIQDMNFNPEEIGYYYEGDILYPRSQQRNGLAEESFRWKNGVVPVEIRGLFTNEQVSHLMKAFNTYHNKSCIRFVQHTFEPDYVIISNYQGGCFSNVGRTGGPQVLNLQAVCMSNNGTVLHELMHVLGFMHEHTREDRDEFVEINWDNIIPATYRNFEKLENGTSVDFDVEYDYGSVLHYSAYGFAVNQSMETISKKKKSSIVMGQRKGFADSDLEKINKMYKCESTTDQHFNFDVPNKPTPLPFMNVIAQIFGSRDEDGDTTML
ncbi:hypothetical protein ACFFRR_000344 [Megaselia abdita]